MENTQNLISKEEIEETRRNYKYWLKKWQELKVPANYFKRNELYDMVSKMKVLDTITVDSSYWEDEPSLKNIVYRVNSLIRRFNRDLGKHFGYKRDTINNVVYITRRV